jgi:hypothetical protein
MYNFNERVTAHLAKHGSRLNALVTNLIEFTKQRRTSYFRHYISP